MQNENDLRVKKTRQNIRAAFIALMEEKPLSEISVKDICDRALCSRNTFYMHYPYKEAVLEKLTQDCVDAMLRGKEPLVDSIHSFPEDVVDRYAKRLIDAAHQEKEIIRFLLRHDSGSVFAAHLADAIHNGFIESAERLSPAAAKRTEFRLYCRYVSAGIVNFLIHWLQNPEIGADEAFRMLREIHSGPFETTMQFLLTNTES